MERFLLLGFSNPFLPHGREGGGPLLYFNGLWDNLCAKASAYCSTKPLPTTMFAAPISLTVFLIAV